jgi:butyrate kinase
VKFKKEGKKMETILALNPGSTSTKISIYEDTTEIFVKEVSHSAEMIAKYPHISEQKEFRTNEIENTIKEANRELRDFTIIAGRGGLLRPLSAGTYRINEAMIQDASSGKYGEHASNLGCMIAYEIGNKINVPSFITDPVSVDEFSDLARLTGIKGISRIALDHPLNVRAVIRRYCADFNQDFNSTIAVVAHLGGGVSVSAFKNGKIIDSNNANESGPFSATRAGGLPAIDIVNICFSGEYTKTSLKEKLLKKAGLISYLGTNDLRIALQRKQDGDSCASDVIDALCYQISKEIAGASVILAARPMAILLTGGMSYSKVIVDSISERVSFIAPIHVYPGSDELKALSLAAFRAKNGLEPILTY